MITFLELKTQARERANMENSEFVSDSELASYLNSSLAELHDLLIASYGEDYYVTELEFTTDGSIAYALPNGTNYSGAEKFYKLRGVDAKINNDAYSTVKRFNFNRRNDQNSVALNLLGLPYLEYRLVGSNIRFNRTPDTGTTIRLWYHPKSVVLVDDADIFDDINGYADYVLIDTAIKMLAKEESDVSVLMAEKQAMLARIVAMAGNRDANEPESVSDIYAEDADYLVSR